MEPAATGLVADGPDASAVLELVRTLRLMGDGDAPAIGLLEELATTRAIRRFTDDPIPGADLSSILWHTTGPPSGSNRQPFRFLVLQDGPRAEQVKALPREAFRTMWARSGPTTATTAAPAPMATPRRPGWPGRYSASSTGSSEFR